MRIVFFGTPLFAASILEFLFKKPIQIAAIVTKPDKPQGRSQILQPPAVKELAQKLMPHIPIFQPLRASSPEFAETLKAFQADLFVVVAYSEIIKANLLEMPKFGCINIHASILPKFRGAAPIQRCLMSGEQQSGVTIIQMVKELDAGDMLAKKTLKIPDDMNAGELSLSLCELGKVAVWEVIQNYEKGTVHPIAQDHSQATYAHKIKSEDCWIDWSKSALEIHNLIRGATPKPGAWCLAEIKGETKRVVIKRAKIEHSLGNTARAGDLVENDGLNVACGDGALKILELQIEGKKNLKSEEFLRGVSIKNFNFITKKT